MMAESEGSSEFRDEESNSCGVSDTNQKFRDPLISGLDPSEDGEVYDFVE